MCMVSYVVINGNYEQKDTNTSLPGVFFSLSLCALLLSPSLSLSMSSWSTWEEAAVGGDYSSETPK